MMQQGMRAQQQTPDSLATASRRIMHLRGLKACDTRRNDHILLEADERHWLLDSAIFEIPQIRGAMSWYHRVRVCRGGTAGACIRVQHYYCRFGMKFRFVA